MVLTAEQKRVQDLLTETVTLLCKNGLHFSHELGIEALIGITLDKKDVFLVSIKETISSDREIVCNSLTNIGTIGELIEDIESQAFVSGDSLTGQSQGAERKHRKNSGVEADSRSSSAIKSCKTGSEIKSENLRKPDEPADVTICMYSKPRKRRRTEISHRKFAIAETEQQSDSVISVEPCMINVSIENTDYNDKELLINREPNVIEIKTENTDEENSYEANAFDGIFDSWNWNQEQKKKHRLEYNSSEQHLVQYSNTPMWDHSTRTQVELVPGSRVFLTIEELQMIQMEEKASLIIRRLVHTMFPDDVELASSSCLGLGKQSRKMGLNQPKVDAIIEYVRRNMPHIPDKKVIRLINNLCCEARRKILRHGKRQNLESVC